MTAMSRTQIFGDPYSDILPYCNASEIPVYYFKQVTQLCSFSWPPFVYISLLELELAFINFLYVFFARHLLMSFYLFVLSTLFCRWLFLLTMPFFVILRLELDWHLSKSISHKTCQLCISIRAQEIHFYSFLKMLMKNQMHCFKLHSWSGLISYRIICQFNSSNLLPAVK